MTDLPPAFTTPPVGYADWLADLKNRIHSARQRAALAVNRELVERPARDLRASFPEISWSQNFISGIDSKRSRSLCPKFPSRGGADGAAAGVVAFCVFPVQLGKMACFSIMLAGNDDNLLPPPLTTPRLWRTPPGEGNCLFNCQCIPLVDCLISNANRCLLRQPQIKGFSARNLKYMRYFAEHCPNQQFGQQPAAQLPWFHIVTLLTQVATPHEREWYATQTLQQGWSRSSLTIQIKKQLFARQAQAVTNFAARLPSPHSGLAQDSLKDPYLFDFLGLGDEAHEREIENALVRHITHFLLELGTGFAFVGRQQRLEVAGDEFFIDLLFYHTRLKCYVVVELKAVPFKPEHVWQLNFYLSAVDAQIKAEDDKPTIGLLLCKTQNRLVAEYALSGIEKPIGVAEYDLSRALPERLAANLPSIAQIEEELADLNDMADEHANGGQK